MALLLVSRDDGEQGGCCECSDAERMEAERAVAEQCSRAAVADRAEKAATMYYYYSGEANSTARSLLTQPYVPTDIGLRLSLSIHLSSLVPLTVSSFEHL